MSIDRNRLEQEAMRLLQKGQIERALERYQTLLRDDPRDMRVRQKVADLYLKVGRHKEAQRLLREIARSLKSAGKDRRAIGVYKQLLRLQKDDWSLRGDLGDCYLNAGFPREAKACFQQVVDQIARSAPDKAVPFQERLIRLDPGNLPQRIRLGELYEAANWGEKSLAHWILLAKEARRLGQPDDRARFLESALRLRADDNEIRVDAAEARTDIGDYGGALGHLQQVVQQEPENGRALTLLGRSLEGLEQKPKARQVWLAAAQVLRDQGDAAGRAHALRRALACGADDPAIRAELGQADRIAERFALRLDSCDWAAPADEAVLRLVVEAETLARYGFLDRALALFASADPALAEAPAARIARIERLADAGRTDEAVEALAGFEAPTPAAAAQVLVRRAVLEGRGDADDLGTPAAAGAGLLDDELLDEDDGLLGDGGGGLVDDGGGLLDDELLDDELLDDEDTDEVVAEAAQLDGGLLDDELVDDELVDDAAGPPGQGMGGDEDPLLAALAEGPADPGLPGPGLGAPPSFSMPAFDGGGDGGLDASFFDDEPPLTDTAPDFGRIFGAPAPAAVAAAAPALPAALTDAQALVFVGALDAAEAALAGATGLGAALLRQELLVRRAQPDEALSLMRDAVDDALESDPLFPDALLTLARLTAGAGKIRGARRLLDEIASLDPSWNTEAVARVRHALELLRRG